MSNSNHMKFAGQKGIAAVELALILPVLIVLAFGIIDLASFIKTRVAVTNLSRGIGIETSRAIGMEKFNIYRSPPSPQQLMVMQADLRNYLSASGVDTSSEDWRVYISLVRAGESAGDPQPSLVSWGCFAGNGSGNVGGLSVESSTNNPNFGLSQALYDHLIYNATNGAADIEDIYIAEVYYKYRPITPLPAFIAGILLRDGDGIIVGSIAYF